MTIQELHIGLELGLQQLNSNLYNRLENEGKDFILNLAINDYVNGFLNIPQGKDNIVSFNSIRDYYSSIYSLLKTYYAPVNSRGSNYIYSVLPEGNEYNGDNLITFGGYLLDGVRYKVGTGGYELGEYGGPQLSTYGDVFTCSLGYASFSGQTNQFINLTIGDSYVVDNPGNVVSPYNQFRNSFVSVGNLIQSTPINTYARYKRVKAKFVSGDTLIPLTDNGYLDIVRIDAMVDTDNTLTGVSTLIKGKYYKVSTDYGINLSSCGGYTSTMKDVVFLCTSSGTYNLNNTILIETKFVPVRILKNQDIQTILKNTYGLGSDNLISEIKDNGIYTYHNDETYVNYIDVVYVKSPAKVNLQYNVTSDLNSKVHSDILNLAIGTTISKYAAKNMAASGQFPQSTQQQ